jgi:aspartyl-tRNA synthetase
MNKNFWIMDFPYLEVKNEEKKKQRIRNKKEN